MNNKFDVFIEHSLDKQFYINNNNDGFNLNSIFTDILSNFLLKWTSDKTSSMTSMEKTVVTWIARSNAPISRDILRMSSERYRLLDPPKSLFNNYLLNYIDFCKDTLKHAYEKDLTHKQIWNHDGHIKMLRNKGFISVDTHGLSINVYLPLKFLFDHTPYELKKWLKFVVKHSKIKENYNAFKVTKCLKEFTSVVKKFRDSIFGENWHFLADLDTCFGYNTQSKLADVKQDIVDWAEYKNIKRCVSEETYINGLKKHIDGLFKEYRVLNDVFLNDFIVDSKYWVVAGSSNGIKTEVFDNTKQVMEKSKAVKAAIYVGANTKNLIHSIRTKNKAEPFSPNVKIEIGFKNRLILACGNIEYIQMTYVSHHIEKLLKKNIHSTLFNDNLWKIKNYVDNLNRIGVSSNIYMPFDAAGFDKYVTLTEIQACFSVFEKQIRKHYIHSEVFEDLSICMHNIKSSLDNGWQVKYDAGLINWKGGLPSGLRWTALLGTLINIGRAKYIEEQISKEISIVGFLKKLVGQGDDDDFVVNSWLTGFLIFEYYNKLGIKAHYGKNFLDDRYSEFLKKVIDSKTKTVYSYPTRKITSLFFISPEKSKLPDESYDTINFGVYDTIRRRGYNIGSEFFENTNFLTLQYIPKVLGGFGSKLHNFGNRGHSATRRILRQNRFTLKRLTKNTPLYIYMKKVLSITDKLQFDRHAFLKTIFESFGARLAPYSNISLVVKENIHSHNPLNLLSFGEVLDLLLLGKRLAWQVPRLKKEYAFLPLTELIRTMHFDEMLKTLREFCDPISLNSIEYVLNKYPLDKAKLKVSNILHPKYEFKPCYSANYSDEFMSALFGDALKKLTLNEIIMNDNDSFKNDLSFRNVFVRFEISMFVIFNNLKTNNDKIFIKLFNDFEINKFN